MMQESVNAYEVLGLTDGLTATEADINRAYKKQALKYHPDKAKGSDKEAAAKKFQQAADAKELLSDSSARAALDALLRAKLNQAAKFAGQDAKRRKFREQLEKNERSTAVARSEEQVARERLQVELARLRREAAAKKAATSAEFRSSKVSSSGLNARAPGEYATPLAGSNSYQGSFSVPPVFGSAAATAPVVTEELLRTLKVSWSAKEASYSSLEIREAFEKYGPVQDVVLRDSTKKKSRRSAIVVMTSRSAAAAAAQEVIGDPSQPLLVTPVLRIPTVPQPEVSTEQPGIGDSSRTASSIPATDNAPNGNATACAGASMSAAPTNGAAAAPRQEHPPASQQPPQSLFPIDMACDTAVSASRRAAAAAAPLFPIALDPSATNESPSFGATESTRWQDAQHVRQSGSHGGQTYTRMSSPLPGFHQTAQVQQEGRQRVGGFSYPERNAAVPALSSTSPRPSMAESPADSAGLEFEPESSSAAKADQPSAPTDQLQQLIRGRQKEAVAVERARERARIIAVMEAEDEAEGLAAS